MSIESLGGIVAGAAGSQLAQTSGADVQRIPQETACHQRQIASDRQADNAAGIAATDGQDHEPHQRDADGRRPWEIGPPKCVRAGSKGSPSTPIPNQDAGENRGNSLDLTA